MALEANKIFIYILLNTEYMDIASRKMWYFKLLSECAKQKSGIIITHEYIKKHFKELHGNIKERFFEEFEMSHFTVDEAESVEQYFIPDEIFYDKEKDSGSRTEMLFSLQESNSFSSFYDFLDNVICLIRGKHPDEEVDACFNCLETNDALRKICAKYNIPLKPYSFSALRKLHGYQQTLYFVNSDNLFCTDECEKRFLRFLSEESDFPMLDNKEIIALFGKERTLPLIKLMDVKPKYELLICREGFSILPHVFRKFRCTDDDLHYEAKKYFLDSDIIIRSHALNLDTIRVGRNEVHNDPASTILSARRMISVSSQISLKALLWKRTSIMQKNTLPFSFACEKDMCSTDIVDIKFLNWLVFCYLIPSELMFDISYWKWRLKDNPTEKDIYNRHLQFYSNKLGLTQGVLIDTSTRFRKLLRLRNLGEDFIDELCNNQIPNDYDFNLATSRISIINNDNTKNVWRLNHINNGMVKSIFVVTPIKDCAMLYFYPLDDISGFVKIRSINIISELDNNNIDFPKNWCFYPKTSGKFPIPLSKCMLNKKLRIEVVWEYKTVNEYCQLVNIEVMNG